MSERRITIDELPADFVAWVREQIAEAAKSNATIATLKVPSDATRFPAPPWLCIVDGVECFQELAR